jgi:hypothetical protein
MRSLCEIRVSCCSGGVLTAEPLDFQDPAMGTSPQREFFTRTHGGWDQAPAGWRCLGLGVA